MPGVANLVPHFRKKRELWMVLVYEYKKEYDSASALLFKNNTLVIILPAVSFLFAACRRKGSQCMGTKASVRGAGTVCTLTATSLFSASAHAGRPLTLAWWIKKPFRRVAIIRK